MLPMPGLLMESRSTLPFLFPVIFGLANSSFTIFKVRMAVAAMRMFTGSMWITEM